MPWHPAATTNPLSSSSLKRLTGSGRKSKLKLLSPPRKVTPKSVSPKRSGSSAGSKKAPTSSQLKPSGPTQPATPTKFDSRAPPTPLKAASLNSLSSKSQNSSSPPKPKPALSNKTPVTSNTQPPLVGPPNPAQPENATRPVDKCTHPKNAVQEGPADSVDTSGNPNKANDVATTNKPSLSQVMEPEPNQNETLIEFEKRPEGSPAKSPPGQLTRNSSKSDIESLYASPSPERTVTELEPIELDSDPDFEMMEVMLLSHRGPSQSQQIKKELDAQSPAPPKTKGPLKRQRSRPSPNKSSQAPPQTPQTDSKPVKRPRVNGPNTSDLMLTGRRKHPEFWDLDGTVILQVDDVLFRVMRSTLSKASPWFQRLFSEELDHLEIMADCPVYIIEEDFNHLDFANLLRGLENGL